jgi:hypothetical protein
VPPEDGLAVNDLIDARGNRVIEVGKLTIRVGKDSLLTPSTRPLIDPEPVSIDYDGGRAEIRIAQDGAITIRTSKTMTLEAAEGITLDSDAGVTIKVRGDVAVQKKS